MKPTTEQAIEKLKELVSGNQAVRPWYDSYWTMAVIYAFGNQWGYISQGGSSFAVKYLRSVVDPERQDVRVSLNRVEQNLKRVLASINPQAISADLLPRGGSADSLAVKFAGDTFLERYLEDISAKNRLRTMNLGTLTFGSCGIRRTLERIGPGLSTTVGEEEIKIPQRKVAWAVIYPWEVLRDPASKSLDIAEDEWVIVHEKPQTTEWVKSTFGVDIETEQTMGNLLRFQEQLANARGRGAFFQESKQKAVVVREMHLRDPDLNKKWAWTFWSYVDPSRGTSDPIPLTPVLPNPFYGCPFHFFHFSREVEAPWARGVPHIEMASQDLVNLSVTWLARWMQEGSGKWLIEDGTLENPSEQLNNRLDEPIIFKRNGNLNVTKPERMQPPQMNPATMEIIREAPDWMRDALNLTPVQFGEAVKRGEAASAYKTRLGEANATLEDFRVDYDLELENLLYGTLVDAVKHSNLAQLRDALKDELSDDVIRTLKREELPSMIRRVRVHPATTRPKTPTENRDEVLTLVQGQVLDAETGLFEMEIRGTPVDSLRNANYKKQLLEIQEMVNGKPVKPSLADNHAWHIKTLQWFIGSPRYWGFTQEVQDRLHEHLVGHLLAERTLATGQGQPAPVGQPSPPSEAAEAMSGMTPGSAGAGMQVV